MTQSLISPAWTKPKSIFSIFLFNSFPIIHSLCLFFTFLISHNHFGPTPISHFPLLSVSHVVSFIHSASICLWVSVSISIYVSLFRNNVRSPSWSTNFLFLPLPPLPLIISLCTRLNSHMRGKEEVAEVDQRGEKERRGWRMGEWSSRRLREQGFSYSMLIGSCQLQSTSWCIIQVSLPSAIFALHFAKPILVFVFQTLVCLIWPHSCFPFSSASSSFLFFHLFSLSAYFFLSPTFSLLFHSTSLCSLILLKRPWSQTL